ncbi:unnamed protein product [Eruca vesicaria subsp. sativa]|uniref:Uncharacterized protein n=1 Tax=Eruca vesicaria subsp. sativa TaxID=29727 RepID=A0ABC8J5T7_ERUVS|nr:unnamed protein product [Eruca vesicaria subsp. sativa]
MSRCYPFPPPGFVPNQIKKDESLIESIKKGTKEEAKREKKDRKHNNDKKRKERDNEAGRSRKHLHHKRQRKDDNTSASKKVDDNVSEPECMEKSCLTMELDHQTSSQTSCDSNLHGNENEGQNHIQSQPLTGRHNDSGEFVCLLVLGSVCFTMMTLFLQIVAMGFEETSKRQKYHEVMMSNRDQKQCSSRDDASQALMVCQERRRDPVFDAAIDISSKLSKEKETNRQSGMQLGKEKQSSRHHEANGPSKLCRKRPSSMAMRFLNLIENWSPDQVESKLTDSEDQEWWLLMKVGAKRHHPVSNQTSSSGSSSMVWPSARFLPEAELHALPFTVPF